MKQEKNSNVLDRNKWLEDKEKKLKPNVFRFLKEGDSYIRTTEEITREKICKEFCITNSQFYYYLEYLCDLNNCQKEDYLSIIVSGKKKRLNTKKQELNEESEKIIAANSEQLNEGRIVESEKEEIKMSYDDLAKLFEETHRKSLMKIKDTCEKLLERGKELNKKE